MIVHLDVHKEEENARKLYKYFTTHRFLPRDSRKSGTKSLYRFCGNNIDDLNKLYALNGFHIYQENGYFYCKSYESQSEKEMASELRHIEGVYSRIALLQTYDSSITAGAKIRASRFTNHIEGNPIEKQKLRHLYRNSSSKTNHDLVLFFLNELTKHGLLEVESRTDSSYRVLSTFGHYIKLARIIQNEILEMEEEEVNDEFKK